jgi:hypothetical protein
MASRGARLPCIYQPVVPAKAGIQVFVPRIDRIAVSKNWIPAFAGMTG